MTVSGGRVRVLVIDDSPDDLAIYSRWLLACRERRLTVLTASSLAAGLAITASYDPDCIVLDNDLRDSTGVEFIAELARRGFDPPVIAITGSGSDVIAVELMKAGARDYLNKSRMSQSDLCSAVVAQVSSHAMRHQIALYRERERAAAAQLGAALQRVSFLAETGKLLSATREYDEVIVLGVKRAVPFLGEACLLDVVESEALYRGAVHVDGDPALARARNRLALVSPSRERFTGVAQAVRTGKPIYVSGAALADIGRDDIDLAQLTAAGLVAMVFLPLRCTGTVMGVLTIGTTRPGGFPDAERVLHDDYSQRIAVAIENARSVEAERFQRDRAEAAKRRLTFQSRVSTLFAQSLDKKSTLDKLMKLVTVSFSDSAAMFTVTLPEERISLVAVASRDAELDDLIAAYYADFPAQVADRSGPGCVARTGRSQFFSPVLLGLVSDAFRDERRRALVAAWSPVSEISVPLAMHGVVIGVLNFVRDVSEMHFSIEDIAVAEDVARRTAMYLEMARLYENQRGIAFALQQALLPAELPAADDVIFGVRYFAGAEGMDVGGDWYDIIEIGDARMVITIGDVIGRGVAAAAAMGQYRDILRAYAFESFSPAKSLTRLNDMVITLRGEAFATCTIIVLDRNTRRLHYASAGHPPPMLRLPDGNVRALDGARAMPIGAWPQTQYVEETLEMPVGSTLVLYTDGLVETRHRSAAEGVEVLRAALGRAQSDIELLLDDVLHAVAPDRSDDIAILAVEMLPLQSENLKRWVYRRIDRVVMRKIREELVALLEARAGADSDIHGARLIVGELLSNVVRHAPGPFRLELDWSSEFAALRLYDSGPSFPLRLSFEAPDDLLSMTGRGLFLISRISRAFHMTPRSSGGLATTVVLPVRRRTEERELVLR